MVKLNLGCKVRTALHRVHYPYLDNEQNERFQPAYEMEEVLTHLSRSDYNVNKEEETKCSSKRLPPDEFPF